MPEENLDDKLDKEPVCLVLVPQIAKGVLKRYVAMRSPNNREIVAYGFTYMGAYKKACKRGAENPVILTTSDLDLDCLLYLNT
jgi:hypothetical protein